MLSVLSYGVWGIVGIFAAKLIFWDVPLKFSSYWKGVGIAAGGVVGIVLVGWLFSTNFLVGLIILLVLGVLVLMRAR